MIRIYPGSDEKGGRDVKKEEKEQLQKKKRKE